MTRPPRRALEVADEIASRIAAGDEGYLGGQLLPSSRALSEIFDVDRSTVRKALTVLDERRIVELVPGQGARAKAGTVSRRTTADLVMGSGRFRGIGATIERRGGKPHVEVINIGDVMASSQIAYRLGVPLGTAVLERHRVHSSDENGQRLPIQISAAWFPLPVVGRAPALRGVDTGPGGAIARLEEAGYELRYEDLVVCRLPDMEEQERLRIDKYQPVTVVWRRVFDQRGEVIEAGRRVVNPLLCELAYEYL